jgi:iron complex outermembrane receptor protein
MSKQANKLIAAAVSAALLSAGYAQAQESLSEVILESVTVTGSRVSRADYTAPTPTTIVGTEEMERRAATNVASVLNEIPSFRASTSSQTNGVPSRSPSATFLDLRGLGQSRTLVLVDGKRFVPQISNGYEGYQVDTQQVPSLLVERAEVVTGGASAQWGSDAVGGVVNLVLRKGFEGLHVEAQGGQSTRGDNESMRYGLMGGMNFADGRGNVTLAVDYEDNNGVGDVNSRDWGREHWGLITNPVPGATPRLIIAPDSQFSQYTPGGIIRDTALRGIQFGPGGTPIPFQYGDYAGTSPGSLNMAGGGQPGINVAKLSWISPAYQRLVLYGRASYEISDALTVYAEVQDSGNTGGAGSTLPARDTAIRITQDNAFLPESIRDQMIALGIPSFSLGRISYDLGERPSKVSNDTRRYVLGFEGQLGGSWSWDAHYTYGENVYTQRIFENRIRSRFAQATDAVVDPNTGAIVCRSTLTNPNNGCQPLNVFGHGSPSAAAIDYVTGDTWATTRYRQDAAGLNFSGEPFATWAGDVSVAVGAEYRKESQVSQSDPFAAVNDYEGDNSAPMSGEFDVKEGYLEAVFPLLRDVTGARSLDLNGAVRHAEYSTEAGGQTTWKGGLTWEPANGLMFRAVYSRDIRAPNIYELNAPELRRQTGITFRRANGTTFNNTVFSVISGFSGLKPEKATTTTLGFTWSPGFVDTLRMSLDYYSIELDDRIQTLGAQFAADQCSVVGDPYYCNLFTLNAAGDPTSVQTPFQNIARSETSGLDFSMFYRPTLEWLPGTLDVRVNANYLINAETQADPSVAPVKQAGQLSTLGGPRVRGTLALTYSQGGASVTAQARAFTSTKYDLTYVEGIDINDNSVPGATYVDLQANYTFENKVEVFGTVNNLLDKEPPPVPSVLGYPTNAVYFDMIGTTYKVGFRYKY